MYIDSKDSHVFSAYKKLGFGNLIMPEELSGEIKKETRLEKAVRLVYSYMKSEDAPISLEREDVFVVWYCKTLQNWKALLSAPYEGAPLIEVTYNGDKKETYLDVYTKKENVRISDGTV